MPTTHFKPEEFACHCGCGQNHVSEKLMSMLEVARSIYGAPMSILSGFRCPQHNAAVGGTPSSAHLSGEAVDILCTTSSDRFYMLKALLSVGFNRIGISFNGGFIHADISRTLPQDKIWDY